MTDPTQGYTFRIARAVNRLFNTLTCGDDQETISHRSARAAARGVWWGCALCWALDKVKYVNPEWADHCGKVLASPSPTDATVPLEAPLKGDANETPPAR